MSISGSDLIALDTNVLVHWVRQNDVGRFLLRQYQLDTRADRPLLSTIVEGELRGLARCWSWGRGKLEILDGIFNELVRVDAGLSEVVLAYSELYAADQAGGHNTGENDLWIAATAKAAEAVLLTCDSDFEWMKDELVRVEVVPLRP